MKNLFLILLLVIVASCSVADKKEAEFRRAIGGISESIYIYEDEGKQGLVDSSGNVILKAQFDFIEDWQEHGLILVDSGGRSYEGDAVGHEFNKYGLIDVSGRVLFRPQFDDVKISDNSALVLKDSLYGYVDNKGNWLIDTQYKFAAPFYKGAAIVKQQDKFYLINKQQELISTIPFDSIWEFKNDVAVVEKEKKYGFINYKGQIIAPYNYRGIGDFNWYHGLLMDNNEKWYVVDTTGSIKIERGFDKVDIRNRQGEIFAEGVIDGKPVKIKLKN